MLITITLFRSALESTKNVQVLEVLNHISIHLSGPKYSISEICICNLFELSKQVLNKDTVAKPV